MSKVKNIAYIFIIAIGIWFLASFIDINAHNLGSCKYAFWNVFEIMSSSKAKAKSKTYKVTNADIELLAKLMMAENGHAKDDECVVLTGIVVMKRVQNKEYPNTIKGVIYQRGQYSTASRLNSVEPDERCMEIAEEILRFKLYKKYPKNLVFQSMFPQGKRIYKKIGHEYFCLA